MNYPETLEWMFAKLPMYQTQGASAYRKDLTNTLLLADYLGNPEQGQKFIHIAGTNGKGSTTHMLASILMEAGYKVGYFTSPHLKDFRERIKINGLEIPKDFVTDFINQHKPFFESNNLSFFEMSVGLALVYFKESQCDLVLLETGLGGRLDSTNIVTPLLSVITNIDLDHTQFLGTTREAIAIEKAGIIKEGVPAVIGEYTPETKRVFVDKADEKNAPIYFASDMKTKFYSSDLKGNYQKANIMTAVTAINVLNDQSIFAVSEENLTQGLRNVVRNTGLQGRWQELKQYPHVVCDTAHNKHGLKVVIRQIQETRFEKLHVVLGFVNDKEIENILPLFPPEALYYFCKPGISRGLDAGSLQAASKGFGLHGQAYESVSEAYAAALNNASENDFIYIGGSTFVVAEIL